MGEIKHHSQNTMIAPHRENLAHLARQRVERDPYRARRFHLNSSFEHQILSEIAPSDAPVGGRSRPCSDSICRVVWRGGLKFRPSTRCACQSDGAKKAPLPIDSPLNRIGCRPDSRYNRPTTAEVL